MWSLGVVFILFIGVRNLLFCINYSCQLDMPVILTLFVSGGMGGRKPPSYFYLFISLSCGKWLGIMGHEKIPARCHPIVLFMKCSWPHSSEGTGGHLHHTYHSMVQSLSILALMELHGPPWWHSKGPPSVTATWEEEWLSSWLFILPGQLTCLSHGIVMFGDGTILLQVKKMTHVTSSPALTAFTFQWVVNGFTCFIHESSISYSSFRYSCLLGDYRCFLDLSSLTSGAPNLTFISHLKALTSTFTSLPVFHPPSSKSQRTIVDCERLHLILEG